MQQSGVVNSAFGADKFGFKDLKAINWNLGTSALYEHAIRNGEAQLTSGGALVAETGVHTGRSPKDKFTVRDANTENSVWWGGNQSITAEQFETLYQDFIAHAKGKTLFAQDLYGGADPAHRIKTRVYTELAWHSQFIRSLLIRPELAELASFAPELTIVDLPTFKADPARHGARTETMVAIDFARKIVLSGRPFYAGEITKSVFPTLNYYLPAKKVMPMHCSATVGPDGVAAIFFGLASLTDFFDGYFARRFKVESNMGRFMDPIADKILVLCAIVMLLAMNRVDPVMVFLFLARDIFIGGIRSVAAANNLIIAAKPFGKWKTAFQMAAIPCLLVYEPIFGIPLADIGYFGLWISVGLSLISGAEYTIGYYKSRA